MKNTKFFDQKVINSISDFLYDFFIKYSQKLNKSDFLLFLKNIKTLQSDKLYTIFKKWLHKKDITNLDVKYNKMLTDILHHMNTFNVSLLPLEQFVLQCLFKCISLFSKFNIHGNGIYLKDNIIHIIKKQIFATIPLINIIDQNKFYNLKSSLVYINYAFDDKGDIKNDKEDIEQDLVSKIPNLSKLDIVDYLTIDPNTNYNNTHYENDKRIEIPIINKKYLTTFYKNLI